MVELKQELSQHEQQQRGKRLVYQSLGRFDQQVTTKPHRDGGPDESVLMLGYEPSSVTSRVSILDYSHCAYGMGLTPAEFLEHHNPMFADGQQRLSKFTMQVPNFDNSCFVILVINNSVTRIGNNRLLGVLHTAEILQPSPDQLRVVNSTMISCVPMHSKNEIPNVDQQGFLTSDVIRNPNYR